MSNSQPPTPKDKGKGKGKSEAGSPKQNSPSTTGIASNFGVPNPFKITEKQKWKDGLNKNDQQNMRAADKFEAEDLERERQSPDLDPENAAMNTRTDEAHALFAPTLGNSNDDLARRQRVRNLAMKLDKICGVTLASGKLCRQDLGCGKHSPEMKRRVDRGGVSYDELVVKWKNEGNNGKGEKDS